MTPAEIKEIFDSVKDPVTQSITRFGEAAQMPLHPFNGINRFRIAERVPLAQHLAGEPRQNVVILEGLNIPIPFGPVINPHGQDIEEILPEGNPVPAGPAIIGVGEGNRDTRGNILPGEYNPAQNPLIPANRALAMYLVAIYDEIANLANPAIPLQPQINVDIDDINEINAWVNARTPAVREQARADIDALGAGLGLPAIGLGIGIGREAISVENVNFLIEHHVYNSVRSRQAAELRLNAQNFAHIADLQARIVAIAAAQAAAGGPTAAIQGLTPSAARVYRELLAQEHARTIKIAAETAAAQARFNTHHFPEDLQERIAAIGAAQQAAGGPNEAVFGLSLTASQIYRNLLAQELQRTVTAFNTVSAQAAFKEDKDELDGMGNLQQRLEYIIELQDGAGGPDEEAYGLSIEASQIYRNLLAQERTRVEEAIAVAAAQAHFEGHHFPVAIRARLQEVINAQAAAGGPDEVMGGLTLAASRVYRNLLAQEHTRIDKVIVDGQAQFAQHHFAAMVNIGARRQAIVNAQAAVGGLNLTPEVTQIYNELLGQGFNNIAAAQIAGQNYFNAQHNFGGIANVRERRQVVEGVLAAAGGPNNIVEALTLDASRAYRELLQHEMTRINASIEAGRTRFHQHHFVQMQDTAARRQAAVIAQAAVGGLVLEPDVAQIYGELLAEEIASIDIAQARFNAHHFVGTGNLVVRRQEIVNAQNVVGGLGLAPTVSQVYSRLLTQEMARTDLAIAAQPIQTPISPQEASVTSSYLDQRRNR